MAQILAFEKSLEKGKKDILRISLVFIIIIIIRIEKGVSSYLKDTYLIIIIIIIIIISTIINFKTQLKTSFISSFILKKK